MKFRTLRDISAIVDPKERRLAALDRLEEIQRMAAGRFRMIKGEKVYDPDGTTILKAEELAQRLLNIDPAPPLLPDTAPALEPFNAAPPRKVA